MSPFKGNDFQHTLAEAVSANTYDKYGEEHDDAVEDRMDVANGARKDMADKLRAYAEAFLSPEEPEQYEAFLSAANLVDPYSGHAGDGSFARYALQGEPGAKHFT
jgi:hypothetical protein